MIIDDKEEGGEFIVSLTESQFITSDETFICRRERTMCTKDSDGNVRHKHVIAVRGF